MSKKVKNLIVGELTEQLKNVDAVAVINPRGIDSIRNNQIRRRLKEKGVRVKVIKNTLMKRAAGQTGLKGFEPLLEGPCALVFGKASISTIARMLMTEKKNLATLELRGIFFDGEVYAGEKGIEQVSKLPTREEAIATLVTLLVSPGRKLAGALKGPGGRLAGVLKTIEEKAKEKEVAAPAAAA